MEKAKLTARQQQVLRTVEALIHEHGCPPTRGEVARAMGFRSVNAAEDHLRALARKGYLSLQPNVSRGIRLVDDDSASLSAQQETGLPLVGQVAAGQPILAEQNIEARYQLDSSLFHPAPDYLLKVRGESMINAGIQPGDLLAIHRTPEASNRQIVVARLDDEVTVKRFMRDGPLVRLLAENPAFTAIEIDLRESSLTIEGRVVGIIRNDWPT